jgi:ABC-type lipoprotein export system ATPase subunit
MKTEREINTSVNLNSRQKNDAALQGAPILEVSSVRKDYRQPDGSDITALSLGSLIAYPGDAISVTGPSGSGKTTLLRVLAAITRPTLGSVRFAGRDITSLGNTEAEWRSLSVGYVFQDINLLPDFSVLENLMLASEISRVPHDTAITRAFKLLKRLGLEDRKNSRPRKLSLGERQRAAVARAVIHRPPMILADEPTASLDAANGRIVLRLLMELCAERSALLITATHDEAVKRAFPRSVRLGGNEAL